MSDRVKEAFEALIEEMEEPPTWQEVRVPEAQPRPRRQRPRSAWVAAGAFVAVLLFGAAGIFLTNISEPAAITVPYVQLDWSQQVEMRCEGMEIVDNGGFDNATVEIWGPTADNTFRVDATAPNGAVETLIATTNESGRTTQAWASYENEAESVFRVSDCSNSTGTGTVAMSQPPFQPRGGSFPQQFVGFPEQLNDGTSFDLAEAFSSSADSHREDTWRGVPVTVYVSSSESTDEYGAIDRVEERWVDLENRRSERWILESDIELLGHFILTIETISRSDETVAQDFFSTDDLTQTRDLTGLEDNDSSTVNTTLSERPTP